ncbi:MAG: hypothetical protein HC859_07195 [Bacteroidia bacterium]|nr:hypothetical protein [Bacteroidia bacterium]
MLWILPFTTDNIGYWFNYGQAPHHARISLYDLLSMMMNESRWERIYVAIVLVVGIYRYFVLKVRDRVELIFTLLVLGMLVEALIFQVTSYVPRDNNVFFHAFATGFILFHVQKTGIMKSRSASLLIVAAVLLWWSEKYWRYTDKVVSKLVPKPRVAEGVVDIHTYIITPDACDIYVNTGTWTTTELQTFRHVKIPASTVQGLDRVVRLARQLPPQAHVLNMSELTPLAAEVPFELDKGVPLWYHLHVGMFDKELETYLDRIAAGYYDLVLFEDLPYLNNFYPFAVQEQLNAHYIEVDHFEAPRSVYPGTVRVYRRK